MLVTVGIVTWNRKKMLRELLLNLERQTYKNFEIIVIDNASTDGTSEMIHNDFPNVTLFVMPINLGPLMGKNQLTNYLKGEVLITLDSDVEISDTCIENIVNFFHKDYLNESGLITPIIYNYYTNKLDRTSFPFSENLLDSHFEIGQGGACATAIKTSMIKELGCLHYIADLSVFGGDEVDICIRLIDLGKKNICLPGFEVFHKISLEEDIAKYKLAKRDYHIFISSVMVAVIYFPFKYMAYEVFRLFFFTFLRLVKRGRLLTYIHALSTILDSIPVYIRRRRPVKLSSYEKMLSLNLMVSKLSVDENKDFQESKLLHQDIT